jgi:biopolymer transport protein ExbB
MIELIRSGGPVMVPLLICSLLAIAYAIERLWILSRIPGDDVAEGQLEEVERCLRDDGEEVAAQSCLEKRGVLYYLFTALMKRYDQLMIERREFKQTREEIERLGEAAGGGEVSLFLEQQMELRDLKDELVFEVDEATREYLSKNLSILSTIGNIAPLLGLLGTITGMIIAFQSIAVAGTGDPRVVASGISQALVTTATGLIIAIPTIVIYRYLARKADRTRDRVEIYGHAFANSLIMNSLRTGM